MEEHGARNGNLSSEESLDEYNKQYSQLLLKATPHENIHVSPEPGDASSSSPDVRRVLPETPAAPGQTTEVTPQPGEGSPGLEAAVRGILFVGKCKIRETGNATTLARFW